MSASSSKLYDTSAQQLNLLCKPYTVDMDITATQICLTRNDVVKSPEPDPKRTNTKPLSFTNGVLKRQRHHITPPPPSAAAVAYKECLKNHAAALGGHALDGCGEFMPSPSSNPNLPVSLKCAACGCHRNFHRRESEESPTAAAIEYQSQSYRRHHHQPPLPLTSTRATSPSPPPISSSAPHMLLALSTGMPPPGNTVSGSGRKRFRTKFSNLQKEKMYEVAERVGWKMQKRDEELVNELCNEIGVGREVFKVWMHNNKSTFNKRADAGNNNVFFNNGEVKATEQHSFLSHNNLNSVANGGDMVQHHIEGSGGHVTTNGSFSSS